MPKKSFQKKKAWQKLCRQKVVKEGLMNTAAGGWTRAEGNHGASMKAGYKA